MIDQIVSTNTVLILLAVGTILWVVRQIIPEKIEKHKVWKVMLPIIPIVIGIGISVIPQLRPMETLSQSIVLGGVAGSLSSTVYDFARQALGERIKVILGSPKKR